MIGIWPSVSTSSPAISILNIVFLPCPRRSVSRLLEGRFALGHPLSGKGRLTEFFEHHRLQGAHFLDVCFLDVAEAADLGGQRGELDEIGRASCRARGCQYV